LCSIATIIKEIRNCITYDKKKRITSDKITHSSSSSLIIVLPRCLRGRIDQENSGKIMICTRQCTIMMQLDNAQRRVLKTFSSDTPWQTSWCNLRKHTTAQPSTLSFEDGKLPRRGAAPAHSTATIASIELMSNRQQIDIEQKHGQILKILKETLYFITTAIQQIQISWHRFKFRCLRTRQNCIDEI